MAPPLIARLVFDLLIVLGAGLLAGIASKRLGISVLVGFLLSGVLIGPGALGLVSDKNRGLEDLAQTGALLLLFSIGIELTWDELIRLGRYFLFGGIVQMALVATPVAVATMLFGIEPGEAVLIGSATALSSTVLVFKALEEWGQTGSGHGRRAIGILLFQDVALVPLVLLVPLLTGLGQRPGIADWGLLGLRSITFLAAVAGLKIVVGRGIVPLLQPLRSPELVVLFTVFILAGACLAAYSLGLPPALGAISAGVALSGNRLSAQFDALMLPYRETFAAVFFVSLGTLMRFDVLLAAPVLILGMLAGVLLLKTVAAAIALGMAGLSWRPALGMGMGLAQLGELSFVLLAVASGQHSAIEQLTYNRMLVVALGTLVLTPQLLRFGLRWAEAGSTEEETVRGGVAKREGAVDRAIVVGAGLIGNRIASHLETFGWDVSVIDLSPVNLHRFAQQGFRTVAGDGTDAEVLRRAGVEYCGLAVVTVPDDTIAEEVVKAIHVLRPQCRILVRCRYRGNVAAIERSGAEFVVSEESEAAGALLRHLESRRSQPGA